MKFLIDQSALRKSDEKYLPRFKQFSQKILKTIGFQSAALSVLWVRDQEMIKLNKKLMNHQGTTDVISFSYLEKKGKVRLTPHLKNSNPPAFLGELIICLDVAKRNAREYETAFEYECALYLCHGILHCLGFNDKTKKDALEMQVKQDQILKKLFPSGGFSCKVRS